MKPADSLELRHRILRVWKYLRSFTKARWNFADYPIWVKDQGADDRNPPGRLVFQRYSARIINWPGLRGCGDSPEQAVESLQKNLDNVRKKRESMPRPGVEVPIQFASRERINRHKTLADEFVREILDIEWAMLTDESSLWDFHDDASNDVYLARIKDRYQIDVSYLNGYKIADILEAIALRTKPIV